MKNREKAALAGLTSTKQGLALLCVSLVLVVVLGSGVARAQQGQKAPAPSPSNDVQPSPPQQPARSKTNKPQQYSISVSINKSTQQKAQSNQKTPQPAGLNLNIVMTCTIGKAFCSNNPAFPLPAYVGPSSHSCPVLAHTLADNVAVLASLAEFLAANLMPQPPYSLSAAGDTLIISSSSSQNSPTKLKTLTTEIGAYLNLLISDPTLIPPVRVELRFPETRLAGGNAVTALQNAAGSAFSIQPLTSTSVIVTGSGPFPATCGQWTKFFKTAGEIARSVTQKSPVYRTYQIAASDAATALSATALAPSAGGGNQGQAGGSGNGNAMAGAAGPATQNSAPKTSSSGAGTGSNSSGSRSSGQGNGSSGASAAQQNAQGSPANSQGASPSASAPSSSPAVSLPLGHPGDDVVVFPSTTDGGQIAERQRILAALDLPRPQMLINGWVFQSSSKSARNSVEFRNLVANFVNEQNDELQEAILTGWRAVSKEIQSEGVAGFYDQDFTNYIRQRKAYDPLAENTPAPNALARIIGGTGETDPNPPPSADFCLPGQYCLGYTGLFGESPQPGLTDLLLTFIAAKDPCGQISKAVDFVEFQRAENPACVAPSLSLPSLSNSEQRELAKRLNVDSPPANPSCDQRDLADINAYTTPPDQPHLFLECFRKSANTYLDPANGAVGITRAALADFLFNYKMSQMYPLEFTAYDLTQSASSLNRAMEPLMDAFNRDIATFQIYWQSRMAYETKSLISEKNLVYSGVISVRTISGNTSSAITTSQSFLNISSAPELSTILSNLASASTGPPGVLRNLTGNEYQVLAAALQSYQTSEAQIGRSLSIQVQPRSLANASSAEMDVTFRADESAPPARWSDSAAGKTSGPDLSRIATSEVTTHVRVDSLKLFEISSTAAILRAGREKIPLLPPAVELPYIGTLIGWPLKPAESYQTSTAILSAVVMPTATDLANGLRFRADLVLEPFDDPAKHPTCSISVDPKHPVPPCRVRNAVSLSDLGGGSRLREFNRRMVECYASGGTACFSDLSFKTVLAPGN
ncbi:MAG: hypothetical protein ACRD2B_05870 [Terriglobia bacterium]